MITVQGAFTSIALATHVTCRASCRSWSGQKPRMRMGRTKAHRPSKQDRTRRHRGIEKVFWWHVKLQPHVDRIYFRYEPLSASLASPECGRIVVGLFKNHCVLPN